MTEPDSPARGFEQGPIRPPSEAFSLLLRVTRNCPWNRCRFCPVYKAEKFSRREVKEVLADIDSMRAWQDELKTRSWQLGMGGSLDRIALQTIYQNDPHNPGLYSLVLFQLGGGKTAFLQDADSLMVKSEELVTILKYLREKFPALERVTSYARTRTVAKKSAAELRQIRETGLDRLHIGMESGSDAVLELIKKGATQAEEIEAGKKAKAAGFELSEYVMPGLGGRKLSQEHALETAKALSAINPDFIRLRTLAVSPRSPLHDKLRTGEFETLNDVEMVDEIRLFLSGLEGITSRLVSDHMLNLLPELEGKFPENQAKLVGVCDRFLKLPPREQMLFIIGRRTNQFEALSELDDPERRSRAEQILERLGVETPEQMQEVIRQIMEQFI